MADDPTLHPQLDEYRTLFDTPEGQSVADEATAKVQDFLNAKQIADEADARSARIVNNLDTFKSGLVGLAQKDPSATPLALDLVPIYVRPQAESLGAEHADALVGHIQGEIAKTGITSFAMENADLARRALERYGAHLTEEDRGTLGSFIDTMATARGADAAAARVEAARQATIASDLHAHGWLTSLSDPATGDVRFSPNWLRDMAADTRMAPDIKAALWQAHDRLRTSGDPPTSDPGLISDLVDQLASSAGRPTPAQVMAHAGAGLTLADAQTLSAEAFPRTPQQRAAIGLLSDTIAQGRAQLAGPENGAAGQRAFGRFVSWLLPAARAGAMLDPASPDYVLANGRLQAFAPTPADHVQEIVRPTEGRPSLAQIFGGRRV